MKPQSKKINLVLSGTGAFYPVHAGALIALLELGYQVKAISATSGGAIIAACHAGANDLRKMKRMIIDYNPWSILLRKPHWKIDSSWGIYENSATESLVSRMGGAVTFAMASIPVTIVATQVLPTFDRIIFDKTSAPDMTLARAAQISSTIPILFQPVQYKDKTLIDGSFIDNLYFSLFKEDFKNTIAISVKARTTSDPKNFWQYLKYCTSMLLTDQGSHYIPEELTHIPIYIYDHFSPLKFDLTRADRLKLFNTGYQAIMQNKDLKE